MQNLNDFAIFKIVVGVALIAATFGSFRFAQATCMNKVAPLKVMQLPKEFGQWKAFESSSDVTAKDVILRRYINKNGAFVSIVVRSTPANAVLHDLTSCLINASAKPVVEQEQKVKTTFGNLSASRICMELAAKKYLALNWFQQGEQTAKDRWAWRLMSTTNPDVRDAAIYYQAEVIVNSTADKNKDIALLTEMSSVLSSELSKH